MNTTLDTPATARYREKREAVLASAVTLFNEQGVKGATLADIAARVGLATNSVTYYYRKKEDLATACFLRAIDALEALVAVAACEGDAPSRVRALFAAKAARLAASQRAEAPPLMMFNDIRALPESHAGQVFDAYNRMFRGVRALLGGRGAPLLARHELNARTHLLVSTLHWMRQWIGHHELDEWAGAAQRAADALLMGISGPALAWPPTAVLTGEPVAGDEVADHFLRAATRLVNEQGYRGASVERISSRLNVTKGSFYHHHDTKDDLISACFERSFERTRAVMRAAAALPVPGAAQAAAAAEALVREQLGEHGPLLRTTAFSALPDEAHRLEVQRALDGLQLRLASMLVQGLVDGSVRPQDPAIAAQGLGAAINAASELHRWVPGVDAEAAGAWYVRPIFAGLLCPGHPQ